MQAAFRHPSPCMPATGIQIFLQQNTKHLQQAQAQPQLGGLGSRQQVAARQAAMQRRVVQRRFCARYLHVHAERPDYTKHSQILTAASWYLAGFSILMKNAAWCIRGVQLSCAQDLGASCWRHYGDVPSKVTCLQSAVSSPRSSYSISTSHLRQGSQKPVVGKFCQARTSRTLRQSCLSVAMQRHAAPTKAYSTH